MRRKAFTLVEVAVYSVLLLMLVTAVYFSFSISRDYFAVVRATSDANQEAMKAVLGLQRELSSAEPSTIATSTAPPAIRFLSALPAEPAPFACSANGKLLWQRWVVIFLDPRNRLAMSSLAIAPAETLPAPAQWPEISAMTGRADRILAQNIATLTFPAAPSGQVCVACSSSWAPTHVR